MGETIALSYVPDFSVLPDKRKGVAGAGGGGEAGGGIPDILAIPRILTDIIPDKITDILSKGEREFLFAIFSYLCERGEINNYRAQTLTGKSADSVKKYFAKLVQIGLLQAVGKNKGRVYRFADSLMRQNRMPK
ncbi:MAG: hypothetical protein LBO07_02610 [Coriobacteriales bacterium]|nr:hypothetical protein [Coriobacteriales bacterium]